MNRRKQPVLCCAIRRRDNIYMQKRVMTRFAFLLFSEDNIRADISVDAVVFSFGQACLGIDSVTFTCKTGAPLVVSLSHARPHQYFPEGQ